LPERVQGTKTSTDQRPHKAPSHLPAITNRTGGAALWESLVEDDPITPDTSEKPKRQKPKAEGVRTKGWYEPGITRPTSVKGRFSHTWEQQAPNQVVSTRGSLVEDDADHSQHLGNRKTGCLKT
jgi:hypothetical protein